ncbi:MAG: phage tail terminator protein [Haemophilus parainfluenzae]|mgnify:FL=1|jgi:phage minor tail protein U|uniref:phage tail terminator protein n=1 Tax=uncultured Haemophilus sp. TaxID=237779 RepID=UPI002060B733|nr:phage tail terminator protein [uncultured Haemophilus sp.]MDU4566316.1 phage tail terminator protein [Haemophilus parainfluenzae]DAN47495.1 MAG TPA: minor tail protein [Bacteriophage sp.]MDU4638161.1 phage tail terminator protein [Haemophilus parainfluenzae]MDU5990904.1 phage tail terminator protein [Haemophilus parainfluenzae]DAS03841.1 MAG TPA: minor tail protein [Bacteriophage sp.]
MQIHTKIRGQVIELLQSQITSVKHFYSGRPIFVDIDQQKTAISVFIEDAECDEITVCSRKWNAALNVAIYLKANQGEDELDVIAEQVKNAFDDASLSLLDTCSLMSYDIEQDQTNRTWFIATVRYQINYED